MPLSILRRLSRSMQGSYTAASFTREDQVVHAFLKELSDAQTYLEVGSGTGRFVLDVQKRYPAFDITCVEVNKDLAEQTRRSGLKTLEMDVRHLTLPDESFDVIHCSHLIEHIAYPAIADLLDSLLRILKPNGHLIIRSPLFSPTFYNDLDHIRPYPPQSIVNYFQNAQQQRVGSGNCKVANIWYRTPPISFLLPSHPKLTIRLNLVCKFLWTICPWIHGKADGYVLILKKESQS